MRYAYVATNVALASEDANEADHEAAYEAANSPANIDASPSMLHAC